jgi:hypothetical protein
MSANVWLQDFHTMVLKKSEQVAHLELAKGELEATMLLLGNKVITLFPEDIKDGDQVPDVLIRLIEELKDLREKK